MFRVNLTDLDRAGALQIEKSIPEDDPLWEGMNPKPAGPVEVKLDLTATVTGQVVARGGIRAPMGHPCRRCLVAVNFDVDEALELVWSVPDQLADTPDEADEIRTLDPGTNELDMGAAIREELMLAAPMYVVCREDCRGLCPQCGTNLNDDDCDCTLDEPDPRWDALRELKKD